jgi:hypothetical protein
MVKTRTVVQTRTHAQKYFQKLAKLNSGDPFPTTEELSEKLEPRIASGNKRVKKSENNSSADSVGSGSKDFHYLPPFGHPMELSEESSYYPLENDALVPHVSQQHRNSFDAPSLYIPPASRQDLPQPSPAACGKRKQAELAAAQVLAGSSSIDVEGANALSSLRKSVTMDSVKYENKRMKPLSLSIAYPDRFQEVEASEPGTPWDSEIRALSTRTLTPIPSMPVSTPSEQRQVMEKVVKLVRAGDLTGLQEILRAAQSYANTHGNDFISDSTPITENSRIETTPLKGTVKNTPSALVAKVLNSQKDEEMSLIFEAINVSSNGVDEALIVNLCKTLIEFGASVNWTDSLGNTALHITALKGYEKVGKLVLTKGCAVNAVNVEGNTAVHISAMHGQIHFLDMLSNLGANFHIRNNSALAPLDIAAKASNDPGAREVVRQHMLSIEPRLRTLVLFHQDFLEHTARRPSDWEGPDRLAAIMSRLRDRLTFPDYELEISSQFDKADVALLGRAHSAEYLAFVNDLSKKVQSENVSVVPLPFTPQVQRHIMRQPSEELKSSESCDTSFSSGTLNAARRAAGAVAHAVDRVMLGRNRNAFCAIRPPGNQFPHVCYFSILIHCCMKVIMLDTVVFSTEAILADSAYSTMLQLEHCMLWKITSANELR